MKVFVTGGAGYIGSVVVSMLRASGHEVTVFDNLECGHREALPADVPLIVGDLRNPDEINAAVAKVRPDAVMHFAAYALVCESMKHPEIYFRNNVVGTFNLLEAMRLAGVGQIVFSSSCATFGQPSTPTIVEGTPQHPTNPYGESKLMIEQMLRWYGEIHGLNWAALRYFNACGATETLGEAHAIETHLIPLVLRVALGQSDHVTVFGTDYDTPDGSCLRDYVHVLDLGDAHLRALEQHGQGAYNLGIGNGFSVLEVVESARRITGHAIPAVMGERRPGDPARLVAGVGRARTELGWSPRFTEIDQIVESAWKWHKAHPNGYASAK